MFCGTDIIEVDRIKSAILDNEKFIDNIFSVNEINEIDKISDKMKYQRYAGRFAAKEAVYKAISKILIENNINIEFKDIEIVNDINLKRRPKVNFLKQEISNVLLDYNIDVSISHIKDTASAVCLVTKIV